MKVIILATLISALLGVVLGFVFIPLLRRLKFGQPILKYVTKHKGKSGTPTMGGIIFILPSVVTFFIFGKGDKWLATFSITITLAFTIVGFIDDFLKIRSNNNEGLTPVQKILFQAAISVIASIVVIF